MTLREPGYFPLVVLAFCFLYGGMTVGQLKRDVHHLQAKVEMLESRERDRHAEKTARAWMEPRLNREYGRVRINWVECPDFLEASDGDAS